MRLFSVVFFFSLILTAPYAQAVINWTDVHAIVNSSFADEAEDAAGGAPMPRIRPVKDSYSPALACVMQAKGFVRNLRFFGNFEAAFESHPTLAVEMAEEPAGGGGAGGGGGIEAEGIAADMTASPQRLYSKDHSSDASWNLLKQLFPSANGDLNIGANANSNFAYALTHHLKTDVPEGVVALKVGDKDRLELNVMVELLSFIGGLQDADTTQQAIKPLFKKGKRFKERALPVIKMISRALMAEADPTSLYPKGSAEQSMMVFALMYLNEREELETFIEAISQRILHALEADPAKPIGLVGWTQREAMNNIFAHTIGAQLSLPTPYLPDAPLMGNGTAYPTKDPKEFRPAVKFADCVETALREIFNISLYSSEDRLGFRTDTIAHLPALGDFYEAQPFSRVNDGSDFIRSLWAHVVSNIQPTPYEAGDDAEEAAGEEGAPRIPLGTTPVQYVKHAAGLDFELEPGYLNALRVMNHVLNLNLMMPAGHDPHKMKTFIFNSLKQVLETLNPAYAYEIKGELYEDKYKTSERKDFFGNLDVAFFNKESHKEIFSYKILMGPGHGGVGFLSLAHKQVIPELPHFDLKDSASFLYTMMGLDEERLPADMPALYKIFTGMFNHNTALMDASERLLMGVDRGEIASDHAKNILVNLQSALPLEEWEIQEECFKRMETVYEKLSEDGKAFFEQSTIIAQLSDINAFERFQNLQYCKLVPRHKKRLSFSAHHAQLKHLFLIEPHGYNRRIIYMESMTGLEHLINLQRLYLGGLQDCMGALELHPSLSGLHHLDLDSTSFSSIEGLHHCTQLRKLYLMYNFDLKTIALGSTHTRLEWLSICEEDFEFDPTALRFLTGLKRLKLSGVTLSSPILAFDAGHQGIEELNLNFVDLGGISGLQHLRNLRMLTLNDVRLPERTRLEFGSPLLETIDLRGTKAALENVPPTTEVRRA